MSYLIQSRNYSAERIGKVIEWLKLNSRHSRKNLVIYVTGSIARGDAHQNSDLDVFFLDCSTKANNAISDTNFTLAKADVISMIRELHFPEFSRDGYFLKLHRVIDILDKLGSPTDDYSNCFTARMLLLLESRCVQGEHTFSIARGRIVESYLRDYHEHRHNFLPIFLINDIQRYWRTLCLNYEHNRNLNDARTEKAARHHVKNLKLKFSRMLTCFSAIIPLASSADSLNADRICDILDRQPMDRITKAYSGPELKLLTNCYEQFLKIVSKGEEELLEWIMIKNNRIEAFKLSDNFSESIFRILEKTVRDPKMRRCMII